ncbi:NADAR family protein [Streptomyces sp. RKAG293]|uniref:NADAR family protein n=1 Tax=Streptomyces sp. RKAG293 TaxID=2893403 RepID=UPI0020333B8E|nr:NADAR family protein [Streptomyces sp. RKAG293]MCM2418952.1 NADAR family protein [Streptomyces sp. RKAG293]
MPQHRTYRHVDGEQIPGITRPAFIRNGSYYLTDLIIYADGLIDCWGLVDLAEFEEKLRSGWVATTLEEGARASVHHLAVWKFAEPQSRVTPETLLGEVRDEIDKLNDRPDSRGRCRAAVNGYLADRTEDRRQRLLDAYLAVPEHLRRYLGDMDSKDWPVQVLAVGIGGRMPRNQEVVTEKMHASALDYFAQNNTARADYAVRHEAFGPVQPQAAAITLTQTVGTKDWPENPGLLALRNEYPCPVNVCGVEYPNVDRAYLALSTDDKAQRQAVLSAENDRAAQRIAESTPRRPGWAEARPAVMAELMRAKYAQHPALAQLLLGTSDAKILYSSFDSLYWGEAGERGRNWVGRLLELIRSELAAEAAGLGPAGLD